MRIPHTLPLVGLLAAMAALAGCSDEKKGEPSQMTKPAPAADPTRPEGQKAEPPRPASERPSEKY